MTPPGADDRPWPSAEALRAWRRHVGHPSQVADVRLVELLDGPGRGMRVLTFDMPTGLQLDVLVDRALDLGRCSHRGMPLTWTSPVGLRHPGLAGDDEFAWLRHFSGGLLATCGLDHIMFPEVEAAEHLAYPPRASHPMPLHGRVSTEPARLEGYGVDLDAGVAWAEGTVVQAALFGEVLRLRRRIEVGVHEPTVKVRDRVTNDAHLPLAHMQLYHVNLGWPLLDEGARLLSNAAAVVPRDGGTATMADISPLDGPSRGVAERVYRLDHDGPEGVNAVVNDSLGLALVQRFATATLPHTYIWRLMADGNYVLGVEPSTNTDEGRAVNREAGLLRVLEPGEHVDLGVEMTVTDPASAEAAVGQPG